MFMPASAAPLRGLPLNLDRRIEALVPLEDPALQRRITEIIDVNLADDTLAWDLGPEGEWTHVPKAENVNAHLRFQELALGRTRRADAPA